MDTSYISLEAQSSPRSFAALLDRDDARADFLQHLKTLIATAEDRIRQEHQAGMRGRNVVRHLTALADDVIRTIFQYVLRQNDTELAPCVLLALGGYGRGELNPHSDIDLMFLYHKTPPDALIRDTLYLLWDVGYTLGHSVRNRRDAVNMAYADLSAQTAMLEARFVEGDQGLFQWVQQEIGRRRFTQRRRQIFMRQKLAECQQRHAAFAHTVNLMEPNIKESPGGLRDYHTALWLGTAGYNASTLERLVEAGLIRAMDREQIEAALDFLFQVRNALHYASGRKNDLLSVDVQESIAAALHFTADAQKLAVEHFLTTYYVHANTIFDLCVTVREAVTHANQPRLWRLARRPRPLADGFAIIDGYLSHYAEPLEELFACRPPLLFQAFVLAQKHEVALAPHLSRALRHSAAVLATDSLRRAPEMKALFFTILAHANAAPTLRALHRHGLLGAYLPEFDRLTCLVQYDLYHRYTVEEHTFHAIESLEGLTQTQEPMLRQLAELYRHTPDKALLTLAILLHDLGKDIGPGCASHVYRSGELAGPIGERLGLSEDQRHVLQILVVHHLVMNHLAQRRDITDTKVIADFAAIVATVPILEQLYLLTFADTSGVGPGVWTAWKGALLAELYHRTRAYLMRQTDDIAPSDEALRGQLRPALLQAVDATVDADCLDAWLDAMPARYLRTTPPEQIARHIRLTQAQVATPVVLYTEQDQSSGLTHVTICLEGRRGIFSIIAGTLSRHNLNILGAQIYTSKTGLAIDTLQVEALDPRPIAVPALWQQIEAELRAALRGERAVEDVRTTHRYPGKRREFQTFMQPPQVTLDNASSDTHTIIEVQAQDSLGLLYVLTRSLYEQGLNIALAKISTEANRAIDVFYVTDTEGRKLLDDRISQGIKENVLAALQ
jgi:[protein-PII] uridylyltransferase